MRTLAQPTSSTPFDASYLRRSAARLDFLAERDASSARLRTIARGLADVRGGWTATVLRAWQWLPTRYVAERTGDHWQVSLETLQTRFGDCEDWSVLLAALLKANRVDCRLLTVPQHVAVAVRVPTRDLVPGTSRVTNYGWQTYTHLGRPWLFLESTLEAPMRRTIPPGFIDDTVTAFIGSPYLQIAGA